ncbi:SDR family oxidoreductase [Aestuariibacter sp. AA17]|uniref:SDR family oxidoreductase n=1 Tax=Fluctibacter corallii TaxID=2984329 RepID=A0ABT3AAV0_9ALTE|nr:SDR family oxidoreductase [Aestuariibacter sp. AA17]MCV2885436.1 SDR family oxidoreductase [Aestuariibacter sp. AA17]
MRVEGLFSLQGKVIVITGAAGLLGRRHAEAVGIAGGIPVLLDKSEAALREAASYLESKNVPSFHCETLDITNEVDVSTCCEKVLSKFGHVDGLINNAANNPAVKENDDLDKDFSRLENFPLSQWQQDMNVGVTGAFLCAKYFGYAISKNPEGGTILNISSDLGLIAPDQRLYRKEGVSENNQPVKPVTYSVAKTALIGLTRYLATYWADKNVRSNVLCPGGVENGQGGTFIQHVSSRIPLGRMAKADEYQGTVIWLLSQAASYVNGSVISADGGRTTW